MTTTAARLWLPAYAAANRAGISVFRLQNLAIAGQIRTKVELGQNPRYNAEDIERLAAEIADPSPSRSPEPANT
jgi:predicted site-specific integrase-resolvase